MAHGRREIYVDCVNGDSRGENTIVVEVKIVKVKIVKEVVLIGTVVVLHPPLIQEVVVILFIDGRTVGVVISDGGDVGRLGGRHIRSGYCGVIRPGSCRRQEGVRTLP